MQPSLKEYLSSRKAEIKALQAALRKEMNDILAAEAAIAQASPDSEPAPRRQATGVTIKDMVIDVLESLPTGATAHQIIEKIKEKHSKDIPRYSMSPQLSRLKDEGHLVLGEDKLWRLGPSPRPKKTEAPQGTPVGGDVEASPDVNTSGATQTEEADVEGLV